MPRTQQAWLLVAPIATLGVLVGHELAYIVTGAPTEELHGYLTRAPQVALVLTFLSMLGSVLVTHGTRLALWPFPAVTITGFVAQEHLERLQHMGTMPLVLDDRVFLVGVLIQCIVALVAWFVARMLVSALVDVAGRARLVPRWWSALVRHRDSIYASCRTFGVARPRAPPPMT